MVYAERGVCADCVYINCVYIHCFAAAKFKLIHWYSSHQFGACGINCLSRAPPALITGWPLRVPPREETFRLRPRRHPATPIILQNVECPSIPSAAAHRSRHSRSETFSLLHLKLLPSVLTPGQLRPWFGSFGLLPFVILLIAERYHS